MGDRQAGGPAGGPTDGPAGWLADGPAGGPAGGRHAVGLTVTKIEHAPCVLFITQIRFYPQRRDDHLIGCSADIAA